MGSKLIEKIEEDVIGKWSSIPIFAISSVIFGVSIVAAVRSAYSFSVVEDNVTYSKLTNTGFWLSFATVLCFVILNLYNAVDVFKKNHIRKAKRNRTGILINLDAPNHSVYKETERKFGNEFQSKVFSGFDVVFVPYGKKKINYREQSFVDFLRKKRCLLFLNIGINTDNDGDSLIYDLQINGSIIHKSYEENVEQEFQKEFSAALQKFKNIVFPSKEMVKRLRVTASEMSLACQYVIGLSLFLNGEFDIAESVLCELVHKIDKIQWKNILESAQRIRYEIFITFAFVNIDKYQRQCDDEDALDKINEYTEKAQECIPNTSVYYLNKAYYCIAKKQDSLEAKKYINICKQRNEPPAWKYSDAFLKAYENKPIGSICSSYRSALKVKYDNKQDLIIFVEMILEKEPNRLGLYLALGILYKEEGDISLSRNNLELYIKESPDPAKAREILIKKSLLEE